MFSLASLLEKTEYELLSGDENVEVSGVIFDSRRVEKDCLFVCIRGSVYDAHNDIDAVIEAGAAVIVTERDHAPAEGVTFIRVADSRLALANISAAYFGYPAEKIKVIGITGTKGKTTTTYMVKSVLEKAGYRVGLIGTIETLYGDVRIPSKNTTPESYRLQEIFADMVEKGFDCVVMEVSSQGLKLHRTAGFTFEIGIFTNLGRDHIGPDEHADFEEYMYCKSLLFRQCRTGIINCDDEHWQDILKNHTCSVETFGFSRQADLRAENMQLISGPGYLGVKYHLGGKADFDVEVDIPGRFSVYNSLAAIAICRHFNVPESIMKEAVKEAKVKGRIEMVKVSDEFTLMIDYAHNAMSLESLLVSLKEYNPKRIVVVFGCGGSRSKERRFNMGRTAGELADFSIITSDNPRNEEPAAIIADIEKSIKETNGKYITIEDRREAIAYAIKNGRPGDVIVLAGKGHEDYQEIKGKRYHMDEREIIADVLNSMKMQQDVN